MNISAMIANHIFMTAIFLSLLLPKQAQACQTASIIFTNKGKKLEKFLAFGEKLVPLDKAVCGTFPTNN